MELRVATIYYLKCPFFLNQKLLDMQKNPEKFYPYTEEKAGRRNYEWAQLLALAGKHSKAAIINMFK